MARSDLQGQTGGSQINDFEFTVTDAWFGISPAFKEKTGLETIFLHMVGQTDLDDRPVLTEEGFHPSFNLSDDWEVIEDGKKVRYVGSGKPVFGKWYGRLCNQAFEITEHVADDPAQDPFYGDNHPSDASNWIGTKWFMQEKEYDFGTQFGKSTHLMPVRYLGKVDVSAAAPASAPTAAAAPAASSNGALREQVENLARSLPDYATFQKAALAIPGVMSDTALVMDIADQTKLYDQVRS